METKPGHHGKYLAMFGKTARHQPSEQFLPQDIVRGAPSLHTLAYQIRLHPKSLVNTRQERIAQVKVGAPIEEQQVEAQSHQENATRRGHMASDTPAIPETRPAPKQGQWWPHIACLN